MNDYWKQQLRARTISRRTALALGASSLSAAVLAACGGDDKNSTSSADGGSAVAGKPVKGGTLSQPTTEVPNWNVATQYTNGTGIGGTTVYDRLLSSVLGEDRYYLEGTSSIELSEPMKVVIKLRPNMVYQNIAPVNGRPVKSSDIAAYQDYVKNSNAYDKTFQTQFLDHVETPDDLTAIYVLKKPSAYIFGSTQLGSAHSQFIIPQETLSDLDKNPPIGSGPYQQDAGSELNGRYLYSRFDKYRDADKGLPYIDKRQVITMPDIVAQEAAFRAGQLQVGPNNAGTAERIVSEMGGKAKLASTPGISIYALHFNMNPDANQPWRDVRVREAIYRLTNRQQFLDLVFQGQGTISWGPIPVALKGYEMAQKDTEQYWKQDIKAAKQLLDAAKFDYSKSWESIPFGGIPGSIQEQGTQIWKRQAAEVGIQMTINASLPSAAVLSQVYSVGKYDMILANDPGSDTPSFVMRSMHSNTLRQSNFFGLFDPAIDALVEKSETTTDVDESIKIVKQIQLESLKKYTPYYNILSPDFRTLHYSNLQDFEVNPIPLPKLQQKAWIKVG